MRSRAMVTLLAALVVADMVSSGLCCLLTQAAAPPDRCCTAESTTPFPAILDSPGAVGQPNCVQECYEAPGSAAARQGTGSTADRHGDAAYGWVAEGVSGEDASPCVRYALPPPTFDGDQLAPTPRGPPVS